MSLAPDTSRRCLCAARRAASAWPLTGGAAPYTAWLTAEKKIGQQGAAGNAGGGREEKKLPEAAEAAAAEWRADATVELTQRG